MTTLQFLLVFSSRFRGFIPYLIPSLATLKWHSWQASGGWSPISGLIFTSTSGFILGWSKKPPLKNPTSSWHRVPGSKGLRYTTWLPDSAKRRHTDWSLCCCLKYHFSCCKMVSFLEGPIFRWTIFKMRFKLNHSGQCKKDMPSSAKLDNHKKPCILTHYKTQSKRRNTWHSNSYQSKFQ